MRLGLFGGTFDPIHLGHLILAEQCREACGLDRVWLVVAGSPPHKPGGRTAVGHRLEMARIAIAGHPAFAVSDIEATRPGPHYSVETLESIRRDHPGDDLFFLIGADSLADLPTWREPERIAQLATIVVVNRPGIEEVDPARLPDFGPARTRWPRSRSRRWASPPATSAAAWPKAGASATWSPAASRPTSRPTGCIGVAPGGKIRRQVRQPDPRECGEFPQSDSIVESIQTANSTETTESPRSSETTESSSPDHVFLLVIPSSCGEWDDSFSQEQPAQIGQNRYLNARSENWVRFVESARATGQDLNGRSENWVRFVESSARGRPACERPTSKLGSFCRFRGCPGGRHVNVQPDNWVRSVIQVRRPSPLVRTISPKQPPTNDWRRG